MTPISVREYDPYPILDTVPERLSSIEDALNVMDGLEVALPRAGLGHLLPFNEIYHALTFGVYQALQNGRYTRPDVVAQAVTEFCELYVDPVTEFALGNREAIPKIWQLVFYSRAIRRAERGVQFMVPMDAHIEHDLPLVVDAIGAPADYYPDYSNEIRDIINATADNKSRTFLPVARFAQRALTRTTKARVDTKRETAWQNGVRLIAARDNAAKRRRIREKLDDDAVISGATVLYAGNLALKGLMRFFPAEPAFAY
jgi:hypothetical protein